MTALLPLAKVSFRALLCLVQLVDIGLQKHVRRIRAQASILYMHLVLELADVEGCVCKRC